MNHLSKNDEVNEVCERLSLFAKTAASLHCLACSCPDAEAPHFLAAFDHVIKSIKKEADKMQSSTGGS